MPVRLSMQMRNYLCKYLNCVVVLHPYNNILFQMGAALHSMLKVRRLYEFPVLKATYFGKMHSKYSHILTQNFTYSDCLQAL